MDVCMYACMPVCMHAWMQRCMMYACMHGSMYAHVHVCMCGCMDVCVYACMPVCMHACMHASCVHAWMHACMDACMHVWSCMHGCDTNHHIVLFKSLKITTSVGSIHLSHVINGPPLGTEAPPFLQPSPHWGPLIRLEMEGRAWGGNRISSQRKRTIIW